MVVIRWRTYRPGQEAAKEQLEKDAELLKKIVEQIQEKVKTAHIDLAATAQGGNAEGDKNDKADDE